MSMIETSAPVEHLDRGPRRKDELAAAVAAAIPQGSYVNLGIGQPTTVADFLTPESGVVLHTENGMLNMGPAARPEQIDLDLINAGKIPVTELPGASYFHHADSFAMMRGGHLDVCVLGAFQVSVGGDLANWHTGAPDAIPGTNANTSVPRTFATAGTFEYDCHIHPGMKGTVVVGNSSAPPIGGGTGY